MMNVDNPVLKLCQEGMRAEADGRPTDAKALFEQAWQARTGDYEACVAAHYAARHQDDPDRVLWWNETALRHADAVGDETVAAFYPSLHVSIAMAHERLARAAWERASERVSVLPDDAYGDQLREAIVAALRR